MNIWTRRLMTAGVAVGALAAGACGRGDVPQAHDDPKPAMVGDAGSSDCPGNPAATARADRSSAREEIVLDGETFVVRVPRGWELIDESDSGGESYALVSDDRAVVVAVASGAGAVEVRDVAELVAPLDATTPAPVRFAGARGCHLSIEGEDGGDRYEVWVADGGGAIAAIAGGSPYDTAAWREVHAIVDSIEKADA